MMMDSPEEIRKAMMKAHRETSSQVHKITTSAKWSRRLNVFFTFFATVWIIPLMFIFFYTTMPSVVFLTMFVLIVMSLWPARHEGGNFLGAISLAITILNIVWGMNIYYTHVLFMDGMEGGREYSGVYAGEQPLAYSDAAVLNFAGSARVDASRGVGFRSVHGQMHTYCIAPIIDDTFTHRAEFWAVGIDCCSERGNFECDDAGQAGAHTAVVLPNPEVNQDPLFNLVGKNFAPALFRHDVFEEAVEMASKVHGIEAGNMPLFAKWSSTHRDTLIEDEWNSIKVTIVWAFLFAALCALLQTRLTFQYLDVQAFEENLERELAKAHGLSLDVNLGIARFIDENAPHVPQSPKWLRELVVTRCLIPWVVLMTCVLMWSFMYSMHVGQFLMSLFLLVMAVQIFGMLMTSDGYIYGLFMTVVCVVGIYIGRHNYITHTFRYFAVEDHRAYSNVLPDAKAAEYRDAGKLIFADHAKLMTNMSVGFMIKNANYCAAPIMAKGDWSPTRVDFWAIGEDCCDARGNFRCHGYKDPKAKGGVVFHDMNHEDSQSSVTDGLHLSYLKAIRAAKDLHTLQGDDDPTLLLWGPNLKELQYKWMNEATGVCVMTAIVALQVLACGTLTSFCYGRSVYKARMLQFQQDLQREHHAKAGTS